MEPVQITSENFQALVMASPKTVLLDFWAPWCGPCRMIAPMVEQIAREREDVLVGKINVDGEMELAAQFGVVSIPTLVVMKNGVATDRAIGYMPKAEIEKMLK